MAEDFTNQQAAGVNYQGEAVVIKAGAGTGKTSVLRGYAKANPHLRMLYLCYNKAIQVEASSKFPKNVICRTGHAIAFARAGKSIEHKLTGNLRLTDIKNFINTPNWEIVKEANNIFEKFLSSASLEIGNEHAKHLPEFTERQRHRKQVVVAAAQQMWMAATDPNNTFPATHDVYLKLYCLREPELHTWFQVILFDEAQDANPVISDLIYRQQCRHVIVGDDHQQLYRFRGADNSMDAFAKAKKADVLYLTKSFRFGHNIALVASHLLKYKTQVTGCDPFPIEGFEKISDQVYQYLPSQMLNEPHTRLHRTVSGTLKTALKFINKKIFWVGGIDAYNLQEVLDVFYLSMDEKDKIKRRRLLAEFRDYETYKDAAKSSKDIEMNRIVKIIDEHGPSLTRKISVLRKNAVTDEVNADLTISTAHRSKGLEWDTVVLEEDFPDMLSPDISEKKDTDEIADELNLMYVASTRAMKTLQPNEIVLDILKLVNANKPLDFVNYPGRAAVTQDKPVVDNGPRRIATTSDNEPQKIRISDPRD